jgi:hypothetical protein
VPLESPGGSPANLRWYQGGFSNRGRAGPVTVETVAGALEAEREEVHAHCADDSDVRRRSCLPDPLLSRHHYDQHYLPDSWRWVYGAVRVAALLPDRGGLRAHHPYGTGLVTTT